MQKSIFIVILSAFTLYLWAQQAVSVGGGSYAAYTPLYKSKTNEHGGDQSRLMETRTLYITDSTTQRPIPTNDWWTDLIVAQYSGNLWSYPQVVNAEEYGIFIAYPKEWTNDGREMKWNTQLEITAKKFKPVSAAANRWHDWGLDFVMKDNEKEMLVTMAHGVPFTWIETKNISLQIRYKNARFYQNNSEISFPFIGNKLVVQLANDAYGIYVPEGTTFEQKTDYLELTFSGEKQFMSVAVLPDKNQLNTFAEYAYTIPRNTEVSWNYDEKNAKINSTWHLVTENLAGGSQLDVLQGFIPHHYKRSSLDFEFTGFEYATPRGKMKIAAGNTFNISYNFNGMLPYFAAPQENSNLKNPFQKERMKQLITEYADKGGFGADTYWGGKGLTQMALYMTFANEMGEKELVEKCKNRLKSALENWFTYTPGESNFFFARYNRWGAMVGYDTSYDSDTFNDHHFHYGYFTYAASLLAMFDDEFSKKYSEMATLLAKDYANWDKNDNRFPFFRTFDAWAGHSYAGGLAGWGGNGQESTSEAMQSWGGLYMLGVATNNKAMRDAGIFGWVTESRGTAEYWFDRDRENIDYNRFDKPYNSNLTSQGIGWWTWFSGDPVWMHSIQWMPISPIMKYLYEDQKFAEWDYSEMWKAKEVGSWSTDPNVSSSLSKESGLGNVVLSYLQIFNPDSAASVFDRMWEAQMPIAKNPDTGGISYYITHSHRTYGDICWDIHADTPTATTYKNKQTGKLTFVAYNADKIEKTIRFYQNGAEIKTIKVPANKLTVYSENAHANEIKFLQTNNTVVEPGKSLQIEAQVLDQYGATIDCTINWSINQGGNISSTGYFAAGNVKTTATITAESGQLKTNLVLRIDEKPSLQTTKLLPAQKYLEVGKTLNFKLEMKDQYNSDYYEKVNWEISKNNEVIKSDSIFDIAEIGVYKISAKLENQTISTNLFVSPPFSNIALNKQAVASSQENAGTPASYATDGNLSTRWGSAHSNPQWIYVNLGAISYVSHIHLVWETAYSSLYDIQISDDAQNWTNIKTVSGLGKTESIEINRETKYIRMYAKERATSYGHSLFEFEVYGVPPMGTEPVLFGIDLTPRNGVVREGDEVKLAATGFDQHGNAMNINPVYSIISGNGTINQQGIFIPAKYGNATVQAKVGNLTAKANFLVEESIKLTSIAIQPKKASLIKGQGVTFTSTAKDQFAANFKTESLKYRVIETNQQLTERTFWGNNTGSYKVVVGAENATVSDTAIVEVKELSKTNLAFGKPVSASSYENDGTLPSYINDGNITTRWGSAFSDPESITIDLLENFVIDRIHLFWQTSYATDFEIKTSLDEENWQTVYTENNGNGGNSEINIQPLAARFVKLICTKRNTAYGSSLWELEVYGSNFWAQPQPTSIEIEPQPLVAYLGEELQLSATVFDQYGLEFALTENVQWSINGGGVINDNARLTPHTAGEYWIRASYKNLQKEFPIQILDNKVLTSIVILPSYVTIKKAEQYQFSAKAVDQFGNEMTTEIVWSCDGGTISGNGIYSSNNTGLFNITAQSGNITSTAKVEVIENYTSNLALGKTVTASSGTATAAVDGSTGTRWESNFVDGPEWLMVDLGDAYQLTDAEIVWEAASANNYEIQLSKDAINWTTLKTATALTGARTDTWRISGIGRYLRVWCTKRATVYGYSIWELRAFGKILNANEPYQIEILSPKTNIEPKELIQFTANVRDKNGIKISNPDLNWSVTGLGSINATGTFSSLFAGKSLVTVSSKLASESIEILVAEKTNETQQLESALPYKIFRVGNTIKVEGNNINCIYLYDVFGRKLYEEKNTGNSSMEISIPKTNSVLIIKIQSQTKIDSYKIM